MAKKAAPKTTKPKSKPKTSKPKASKPKATKPKATSNSSAGRLKWLDDKANAPLISDYAQQMTSFIQAMADGVIEEKEIEQQEARVVKLMKEIEPLLDDELHGKVTQMLCEVVVYDLMQTMQALQQERMTATFRG
jgi:hypothetical protein